MLSDEMETQRLQLFSCVALCDISFFRSTGGFEMLSFFPSVPYCNADCTSSLWPQDSLILEKSDMHHPVCSFQDDFQEFEMIDDEDDDDEEEEEEEGDLDAPPSPSASPPPSPTSGTLKSRPTMLNLTSAVSQVAALLLKHWLQLIDDDDNDTIFLIFCSHQDCLNNNSSQSPKKGSWQDSLCNPASQGEHMFN